MIERLACIAFLLLLAGGHPLPAEGGLKIYRHEPFRHLEFPIPSHWEPVQSGFETAFRYPIAPSIELRMQTVAKTDQYSDADGFLSFLAKNEMGVDLASATQTTAGEFNAVLYVHRPSPARGCANALLVDVEEGLLWFYLGSDGAVDLEFCRQVIEQIQAGLDFQ